MIKIQEAAHGVCHRSSRENHSRVRSQRTEEPSYLVSRSDDRYRGRLPLPVCFLWKQITSTLLSFWWFHFCKVSFCLLKRGCEDFCPIAVKVITLTNGVLPCTHKVGAFKTLSVTPSPVKSNKMWLNVSFLHGHLCLSFYLKVTFSCFRSGNTKEGATASEV